MISQGTPTPVTIVTKPLPAALPAVSTPTVGVVGLGQARAQAIEQHVQANALRPAINLHYLRNRGLR